MYGTLSEGREVVGEGMPGCELGEGTPRCRPFLSPLMRMAESLWSSC